MIRINPTKILVGGDKSKARNYIGKAKSQMNILLQDMSFQNLSQGSRRSKFGDVEIVCHKCFNSQECYIFAPVSVIGGECWSSDILVNGEKVGMWMEGEIINVSLPDFQTQKDEVYLDKGLDHDKFRKLYAYSMDMEIAFGSISESYLWEYFVRKKYKTAHNSDTISFNENGFITGYNPAYETIDINIEGFLSSWSEGFVEEGTSVPTINQKGIFTIQDGAYPFDGIQGPCAANLYTVRVCMNGKLVDVQGVFGNNNAKYIIGQQVVVCQISKDLWGDGGSAYPYYIIVPFVLSRGKAFNFYGYQNDESGEILVPNTTSVKYLDSDGNFVSAAVRISPEELKLYSINFAYVETSSIAKEDNVVTCYSASNNDFGTEIGIYPALLHANKKYYDYIARNIAIPEGTTVKNVFEDAIYNCVKLPDYIRPYHYNAGFFFFPPYYGDIKFARHAVLSPHSEDGGDWKFWQTEEDTKHYLCMYKDNTTGAVVAKTDSYNLPVIEAEWHKYLIIYIGYDQIETLLHEFDEIADPVWGKVVIWDIEKEHKAHLLNAAGTAYLDFPCDVSEAMHWLLVARATSDIDFNTTQIADSGDPANCSGDTVPGFTAIDARQLSLQWWSPLTGELESTQFIPTCEEHSWIDIDKYNNYTWAYYAQTKTISWELKQGESTISSGQTTNSYTAAYPSYEATVVSYIPDPPPWNHRVTEGSIGRFAGDLAAAEDNNDGFKAAYVMLASVGGDCLSWLNFNFGISGWPWDDWMPYYKAEGGISLVCIDVQKWNGTNYSPYAKLKNYLEGILTDYIPVLDNYPHRSGCYNPYLLGCPDIWYYPPEIHFAMGVLPHNIPLMENW